MNNFNLNLFKYFYYVAYYNGFTNASKKLNIAQSALSYNIKQLESQMDKILIIRNNKKFELTEDGYNLYENLKSVFKILNHNLEQFNDNTYNEITIGVRHYLSDFIFKDTISEFIKKYPKTHLNIKLYSKLDIKKFDDEYDILIDYEDYTNLINGINKINICTLDNILIAGKELAKNYENINSIKDLSDLKLISMCPNKKNGKFQKLCYENSMLFESIISINDSVLCKKLIKDNIGLCLINSLNIKEELATGEVKQIKIKEKLFEDKVVLVYKNSRNIESVRNFINIFRSQYREDL